MPVILESVTETDQAATPSASLLEMPFLEVIPTVFRSREHSGSFMKAVAIQVAGGAQTVGRQ